MHSWTSLKDSFTIQMRDRWNNQVLLHRWCNFVPFLLICNLQISADSDYQSCLGINFGNIILINWTALKWKKKSPLANNYVHVGFQDKFVKFLLKWAFLKKCIYVKCLCCCDYFKMLLAVCLYRGMNESSPPDVINWYDFREGSWSIPIILEHVEPGQVIPSIGDRWLNPKVSKCVFAYLY